MEAGYSRGDKVATPDGDGTVTVACIDKTTGAPDLRGTRYYWVDVNGTEARYEASDLPALPETPDLKVVTGELEGGV